MGPIRLVIQIPAFDEEQTIAQVLAGLPRQLEGIDAIKVVVVDDGSRDQTRAIALAAGAEVLSLESNRGLARAFVRGLERSLAVGADIIVTIDADDQYDAAGIPDLIRPLLEGRADIVVGVRPRCNPNYSWWARGIHALGTQVMRWASGLPLRDPPSGYRAYTRNAALGLRVTDRFTYTLETLIQCRLRGIRLAQVPVQTRKVVRPSRLFSTTGEYVVRSALTIVRSLFLYRRRVAQTAVAGGAVMGGGLAVLLFGPGAAPIPFLTLGIGLLVCWKLWPSHPGRSLPVG